ncbi:MAG: rhamnulokinase family protein [bacterium]
MASPRHYVAFDLGAESGRVLLGTLENQTLSLEEIHRFPNGPVLVNNSMRWDILRIYDELKVGLKKIVGRKISIESISCDSWGVDYVLLKGTEPMLGVPYHYRDARTDMGFEHAFKLMPADQIFGETGIQFMTLNTLYQLHADLREQPEKLRSADLFLNIGDYINYLFSGVRKCDESLASTTQCYDPRTRSWSTVIIDRFGFPQHVFPEVVKSGTLLGPILPAVGKESGFQNVQVITGCSHDTGAAVAAVPAEGTGWAYLSSGTWSLLGVERSTPIIDDKSRYYNFTNEIGYGGSIRFLKNLIGLWLVQECRREWAREGKNYTYEELTAMAEQAEPLHSLIDPSDARFLKPECMTKAIEEFCRESSQPVPSQPGEYIRCALESLALLYRTTLEQLEDTTKEKISTLHIVGGGSKNTLLNQFAANASGRTVIAGPVECTGIGNVVVQAMTLGHIGTHREAREIVKKSFPLITYHPENPGVWHEAYKRFQEMRRA